MYAVKNPATGETVQTFESLTDDELQHEIELAAAEFPEWSARTRKDRAAIANKAADLFEERTEEFVSIMTREMGKLPDEARGEMGIVVSIFRYYADKAETLLADEDLDIEGGKITIRRRPIGVILGIMPWNFPVYQVARFVAPNLVLGNTLLLKHASNCPESALAIEKVLRDAGMPDGAYRNLFVSSSKIEQVIAHPAVQGVSLTGSERAGRSVAETAGKHLKKVVLELGGSDPLIVLDSDDIQQTAQAVVEARYSNAGQACNAPKRIIVLDELYDDLVEAAIEATKNFKLGDPTDSETTLAPLSSREAAEEVAAQIKQAVADGATLHTGGDLVDDKTAFMTPAVLTDINPDSAAYRDEIFGPVSMFFRVKDVDEAIKLANDTKYGLGASVFSTDRERAREVGAQIDAGMAYVNQAGGSQADMPFGGIKSSGIGRELGPLGIDEFANKMTIRH
jgi:succinate-semialdehyde dehydrogenase/glutarate-semialdehyde dehydrogenase